MDKDKLFSELNIKEQCRDYGVPLYKCPQFLFLLMGLFIIAMLLLTYFIGEFFFDYSFLVIFIVFGEAILFFIIGYAIIGGFEKMARANRVKTDFINLAVHQLRGPLSTMIWGFDDLKSEIDLNEEQYDLICKLKLSAERMSKMVDNLLEISRMEDSSYKLKKEEFNLNELINEVINRYSEGSKKIVKASIEEIGLIKSDRDRMEVVFDNLISNAIKYSKDDGQVFVELKKVKDCFRFTVRDQGIGVPKKDHDLIFKKFKRADNALESSESGSGLGLFLVKKIVDLLEGEVDFKSREGEGSVFWIDIPIKN